MARFALQNAKKLACSEHFWKMRLAKFARHCGESSVSRKKLKGSEQRRICAVELPLQVSSARMLIDLAVTKRLARLHAGKHPWCCDASGKRDCSWMLLNALQQLRERQLLTIALLLCYAGLQLEAAKRTQQLHEEKNWVAEATQELAGRQLRAQVAAQRRIS